MSYDEDDNDDSSMADDLICGLQCSHCGVMFNKEHEYPVLCESCFRNDGGKKNGNPGKSNIPKAIEEET